MEEDGDGKQVVPFSDTVGSLGWSDDIQCQTIFTERVRPVRRVLRSSAKARSTSLRSETYSVSHTSRRILCSVASTKGGVETSWVLEAQRTDRGLGKRDTEEEVLVVGGDMFSD
jgi:hypothetical protein